MAAYRFEVASLVFEDENSLVLPDRTDARGEQRWHALGAVLHPVGSAVLLAFMHTGRTTMAKKSSASSQRAPLKRMKSADIENRKWTDKEIQAVRHAAGRQRAGDDSDINFGDIPRLTSDQLRSMVRLREVNRKVAVSVRLDPRVLDWLK